ncbi:MAG: sulfite exporter TauE/SafE family protein [Phycisphaerales bacterium]
MELLPLASGVFVASLIGSLHCVGMCGGIVAMCGSGRPSSSEPESGVHPARSRLTLLALPAAYNGGRLLTYAGLGAISGTLGRAIDLGGGAFGVPRMAAIVAGTIMIAVALVALLRIRGLGPACISLPPTLQRWLQAGMKRAMDAPPVRRSALIGVLTGFLPCGWLYAFVAASATTGSPVGGTITMIAFWAGTVPAMVAVALGLRIITGSLRRHIPTVTAMSMLLVGVLAVVGRLRVPDYRATVDARLTSAASATSATHSSTATPIDSRDIIEAASELPACCEPNPAAAAP